MNFTVNTTGIQYEFPTERNKSQMYLQQVECELHIILFMFPVWLGHTTGFRANTSLREHNPPLKSINMQKNQTSSYKLQLLII